MKESCFCQAVIIFSIFMNTNYDFDKLIPRRESDSVKWKLYPEDVLPLWVADMDFPSPPEIVEALHERISHPFFGYGCDDDELREVIVDWVVSPPWLENSTGMVFARSGCCDRNELGDTVSIGEW